MATTFAVLAIGAGLVSSSMALAASGAAVRSSDLSPHGAFVPGTPDSVVGIAPTSDDLGYRTITANSFVSGYGDGFTASEPIGNPDVVGVVGIDEASDDPGGWWEVGAHGSVTSIGDAPFYGSMAGRSLNAQVVGMAATPDGAGYWLVAADGGVFSFGDATFYGSMGGKLLNAPVVGMAPSALGGYWLVAADGGVFSFGNASFFGSMAGTSLNGPIVGIAATSSGLGYWLVGTDNGVFTFGDAPFFGPTYYVP